MGVKWFSVLCVLSLVPWSEINGYSIYETPQKIESDGFPSETHHVTTHDGYILEMHRIPHGRSAESVDSNRPVVFVMHGILSASNGFIRLGPEYSLAYNLADAGFDVWLGNARGTKNSRFHRTLDPDNVITKAQFFNFSWDDIGVYDLPAMIDYILQVTGQDSLHYIGHSQGGTVFFVLASRRTEYNFKIRSAHLLAAVGYQEHFPDAELADLAQRTDSIYALAVQNGLVEVYPPGSPDGGGIFDLDGGSGADETFIGIGYRTSDYCTGDLQTGYMCELFGVRHVLRDESTSPDDVAGASVKQFAHYGQNIRDKLFRQFNYGTEGNIAAYGLEEPPLYNLSLITSHVTLHYSLNDNLLDERDVLAMAEDMPNVVVRKVARDSFEHSDYTTTLDARELVTDYIIESIKNAPEIVFPTYTTSLDVVTVNLSDDTTTTATDTSTTVLPITGVTPDASDAASSIISSMIHCIIMLVFVLIVM